jgi:outer membrane receptor protein involved in Fe transport
MAAYLDLRGNYKWNDNVAFYGAIDNTLNTPPPLVPAAAGVLGITSVAYFNTNNTVYDMLGRTVRVGVRFSY